MATAALIFERSAFRVTLSIFALVIQVCTLPGLWLFYKCRTHWMLRGRNHTLVYIQPLAALPLLFAGVIPDIPGMENLSCRAYCWLSVMSQPATFCFLTTLFFSSKRSMDAHAGHYDPSSASDQRVFLYIALAHVPLIISAIALDQFSWSTMDTCAFNWHEVLLLGINGTVQVCIAAVPILQVWKWDDALGIRSDLLCSAYAIVVAIVLFMMVILIPDGYRHVMDPVFFVDVAAIVWTMNMAGAPVRRVLALESLQRLTIAVDAPLPQQCHVAEWKCAAGTGTGNSVAMRSLADMLHYLSHEDNRQHFFQFLARESATENLLFPERVRTLLKEDAPSFDEIIRVFFSGQSPLQINVSSEQREEVMTAYQQHNTERIKRALKACADELLRILVVGAFGRYAANAPHV